jgi:hypothetical protein
MADKYRIGSRDASDVEFTYHGTGKLADDREANYLVLNPLNDFAEDDEYLDIDRIELQTLGQ